MNFMQQDSISELLRKRKKPASPLSFLAGKDRVLIYGAGNIGKDLLKLLVGRGVPVRGFLDGMLAAGTRVEGLEVFHPDSDSLERSERSRYCVIIGIFNAFVDIVPIRDYLAACGYERVVTFPDLHRYFPAVLGDRFWLTAHDFYDDCEPFLSAALALWQDEASKELYRAIVNFRCTHDYSALPARSSEPQYFDATVPPINVGRFIDCGAYDGDSLAALQRKNGAVEAIAAFEPDLDNFRRLSTIVSQSTGAGQAVLFPCGVWSKTTQLYFSAGKGGGSGISESGGTMIQCVALDEVLSDFRPTYIKMDIEGAEYEALLGAEQMIRNSRPALAVCLYHKPGHLWQIPLLIRSWDLGYSFYLRGYEYSGFDLVMYAIPA
jgi:FkbM family methyltransferase